MEIKTFKKYLPHLISLVVFLVISTIYFQPIFDGKVIRQGDIINHIGMSKEIVDHRATYGEEPLWSNSMFGGMPAYQTSVKYKGNLITNVDLAMQLWLPRPAGYLFVLFAGFFILLIVLKIDPWLALAGAIAYSFSSYFFIILEAGHNSKAHAIMYMAPVLAGVLLTLRKKYLAGGALTALFAALEISTNHLQITYYLMLTIIILMIFEGIYSFLEKDIKSFIKASGVLLIAAILAVLPNINNLLITYDYGKHTTRGKSELTNDIENKTGGLDKDYATQWSYGKAETFSLMIPDIKGGASGLIAGNKKAMSGIDNKSRQLLYENRISQYWGDQPFTSGPVYIGAFVVFLFVLGLFIVKGRYKWFLLTATIFSIMLAWGKNFMGLTDIFLDFFPGYNKFRAVAMILVVAELCMPILALLALKEIFSKPEIIKEKIKWFGVSFGLTAGLALLFWLAPTLFFGFLSARELNEFSGQAGQGLQEFISIIETARINVFKADAIRSFLFISAGAFVIILWAYKKMNKVIFLIILPIIFLADMMPITQRYLNKENYVNKNSMTKPFPLTNADRFILEDKEPGYRVYNMAANTFNDASTSYYHKSVGGYHGAKLKRYQELIDHSLMSEMVMFHSTLSNKPTDSSIRATLSQLTALNFLNTRYIIYNSQERPLLNPYALGSVWFVDSVRTVADADEEIASIQNFDPGNTAIVDKRFADYLNEFRGGKDTAAKINLVSYKANHIVYKAENLTTSQLAIFSEIYYKDGWNVYIDNNPSPHFRANYVLRGMVVPAGTHTIEFKFEPKLFYTAERLSLAGSLLLFLALIGVLAYEIRKRLRMNK